MKRVVLSAETTSSNAHIEVPDNIEQVVQSTMPDTSVIDYGYDISEDEIVLYAYGYNPENDSDDDYEDEYDDDYYDYENSEEYEYDCIAVDGIEDWARAIADKVNDENLKIRILNNIGWDWDSGMTFGYDGTPFTYDGFTYRIDLS